jgi:histone deacetylase complex regulatory component SIN3
MENMTQNKDTLEYYLSLSVKQQFNIDLDLKDEFIFTENLVSKKTIIAPTFSDKILLQHDIKEFLSALISDINNEEQPRIARITEPEQMRDIV